MSQSHEELVAWLLRQVEKAGDEGTSKDSQRCFYAGTCYTQRCERIEGQLIGAIRGSKAMKSELEWPSGAMVEGSSFIAAFPSDRGRTGHVTLAEDGLI